MGAGGSLLVRCSSVAISWGESAAEDVFVVGVGVAKPMASIEAKGFVVGGEKKEFIIGGKGGI